jgi:hypothetical protein
MTWSPSALRAIAVAGVWIGLVEFVRNELLLAGTWDAHDASLGLAFPRDPVNVAVWVAWSFVFAGALFALSRRFSPLETLALGWTVGFAMMWLVAWNLAVLPVAILPVAVPASLVETGVAAWLCVRLAPRAARG